jgi:predicted nucleic acid-binding protein
VIAVDTSVWIAALRDKGSDAASRLSSLLDADGVVLPIPVRVELMAGVRRSDRVRLRRALEALPVVRPTESTWAVVEKWIEPAANAGQHFGLTDLTIAALAHELGALVWSLDEDFERLGALKFVQLYG